MSISGSRSDLGRAYEGLDDLQSFPDEAALDTYRQSLVARTLPQADFLARRLDDAAQVVEIGCGNGRLLVELARRGTLEHGIGIDLAESRVAFARAWAEDAGMASLLEFEAADALEFPLPEGRFSAALCLTGAFAYFDADEAGAAARLAARLRATLREGGLLCLELYPHPTYRRLLEAASGELRIWSELPDNDPWRFYLSMLELDDQREVLTHHKTFIHRTTGEIDEGRRERLYLYTPKSLESMLHSAGFTEVQLHEGWSEDEYHGGEMMVAVAQVGR